MSGNTLTDLATYSHPEYGTLVDIALQTKEAKAIQLLSRFLPNFTNLNEIKKERERMLKHSPFNLVQALSRGPTLRISKVHFDETRKMLAEDQKTADPDFLLQNLTL